VWAAHGAYGTTDSDDLRVAEPAGLPAADAAAALAAEQAANPVVQDRAA
jgi:hypothetical protein